MPAAPVVIVAAFGYLALLFAIAHVGDRRAREGRSLIGSPWVYTLSMGVYCTAWTYFGSIGRAASAGLWFLPIYLGPTLAMLMAWTVLRKMVRIARSQRITSIADFIASRHGKSPLLAMLVTLIAVVGILPYVALQLKAIASAYALLADAPAQPLAWWRDSTLYIALVLAGFTVAFGARHLDTTERHEGMVAAIAFESLVKLLAFLAVGAFVTWGLFDGPADLFGRAAARPELAPLLGLGSGASGGFAGGQWFALTLLAMLSVLFLPRQFQMMVVENVDERHLRRATWAFPLYLLLINLFVLPIALGGLLHFQGGRENAETFVLSLPLAAGQPGLALAAFIGGLSAATGMVIVEAIAVSTMVCNDLVMPLLLRAGLLGARDVSGVLLGVRRTVIMALLLLGYLYYRIAGEDYALVSIGLISFAAVAQFAPPMLAGMYWKGGTRHGALAGLGAGFLLWAWTLMLPSIAKSGWIPARFIAEGPFGIAWLRPEQLLGLAGLDNLTHALFWSLLVNSMLYFGVSLLGRPSAREASQALIFVDVFERSADPAADTGPVFWRGTARLTDLRRLAARFLGVDATEKLLHEYARRNGLAGSQQIAADARLVQFVERQLAGAIGSASARAMVASVVEEEALGLDDVMRILDEASRETAALRAHSQALEEKSLSLEQATAELSELNEQLKSLDRLKDDFMSSVTHELRTPLTSIRALAELMLDDPGMNPAQRQHFLGLVVAETERLTRLVNQVLDMAKIESGAAEWRSTEVDLCALARQAVQTTQELFRERGATVALHLPDALPPLQADPDRVMQVLVNLLSNAVKFVPPGSGHVALRLHADGDHVVCTVRDNGPGVPPEQQALVFEKFRQGGDAAHRPQGTGLGLPISRRIVEHFGGRMWLEPSSGHGACFGFELPLRQETAQPETSP
ncbi:histidine kinase [Variovorax sp. WS11]|uniref:sensor histidine kinase n=1 Tax=Variovorax sp. WS11 TaxID=1105204 RepID=UPI000D0D8B0A|nr:sensor histidine kinase [Variovorax sp. WS11]NDZ18506.1 histidine kinase [Variovorax sp. WS11]PSL85142.1 histidine kinase [Variovorax sp. WS11]